MNTSELFLGAMRRLVLCFLLVLLVVVISRAQEAGHVGVVTRNVSVFSAQSTTTSSAILPDFGYASQGLFFCTTAFAGVIDLEWSPTGVAPFYSLVQASYPGTNPDTGCHTLQLALYWPNLRSSVTVAVGSLSAWYTASAAPIPAVSSGLGSNGPSSPINCDQSTPVTVANAATANNGIGPIQVGDIVIVCGLSISFNGATVAGTIQLGWAATSLCPSVSSSSNWFTTASTPQLFSIQQQNRTPVPTRQWVCLVNNSGATADINISWASVHGL